MESLAQLSPVLADAVWMESTHADHHEFRYRVINSKKRAYQTCHFSLGRVPPHELVKEIFYGSLWEDSLRFSGLSSFYGSVSKEIAQSSANVLDGGGDGGTSIWLIHWSQTGLRSEERRVGKECRL